MDRNEKCSPFIYCKSSQEEKRKISCATKGNGRELKGEGSVKGIIQKLTKDSKKRQQAFNSRKVLMLKF